jgi:hypothetical protein
MARAATLQERHDRNRARFRSLLLFRAPAWIEQIVGVNWREITPLYRRAFPSTTHVSRAESYLALLWDELPWKAELKNWFISHNVRAEGGPFKRLVRAGANPYELADNLTECKAEQQDRDGAKSTERRVAQPTRNHNVRRRELTWSPRRALSLAKLISYASVLVGQLHTDALRRGLPGFDPDLSERLRTDADTIAQLAQLLDRRTYRRPAVDALQDHVADTTSGPQTRILSELLEQMGVRNATGTAWSDEALHERWRHRRSKRETERLLDRAAARTAKPAHLSALKIYDPEPSYRKAKRR